ncbi:MAG: methyltransferase [Actinomycetota bacterium]
MTDGPSPAPSFDPGSFRDPLSRVLVDGDRVLRVVRDAGVADLDALEGARFWADAQAAGTVVGTRATSMPAELAVDGWERAVEHDRIPVISYPYEWTFSMLRDAALQQLELTRAALADGLLTKDATPFNTQFVGAAPVFIDVGSFERLPRGEPWRGYRQFCESFYNPLLLQAVRDMPFQPWLRGARSGIGPVECRRLLSGRQLIGKGAFTNVVLHARLERRHADSRRDVEGELRQAGYGPKLIDAQLAKLSKVVQKLEWKASASTWSDYTDRSHYGERDLQAKVDFVTSVAAATPRRQIVDLGTNDGHFARLVAGHAASVVAVDGDPLVVDRLYRSLRHEGSVDILPLYVDLLDPSPSLGWRSRERAAFVDRVAPDLTLALALVHHLAISGTVPLPEVIEFLHDLGGEVVVEFPTRDDPMVQRLLDRKRSGLFDHYRLDAFDDAIAGRYEVVRREVLPSGTRHLFHLAPRR